MNDTALFGNIIPIFQEELGPFRRIQPVLCSKANPIRRYGGARCGTGDALECVMNDTDYSAAGLVSTQPNLHRGASRIRNIPPPRTTVGP